MLHLISRITQVFNVGWKYFRIALLMAFVAEGNSKDLSRDCSRQNVDLDCLKSNRWLFISFFTFFFFRFDIFIQLHLFFLFTFLYKIVILHIFILVKQCGHAILKHYLFCPYIFSTTFLVLYFFFCLHTHSYIFPMFFQSVIHSFIHNLYRFFFFIIRL